MIWVIIIIICVILFSDKIGKKSKSLRKKIAKWLEDEE